MEHACCDQGHNSALASHSGDHISQALNPRGKVDHGSSVDRGATNALSKYSSINDKVREGQRFTSTGTPAKGDNLSRATAAAGSEGDRL